MDTAVDDRGKQMERSIHKINRTFRAMINSIPEAGRAPAWRMAWGISALMHGAGLGLLALIALSHPQRSDCVEIFTEFADAPAPFLVQIEPPLEANVARASSAGGRPGAAGRVSAGIETGRTATSPSLHLSGEGTPSPVDFEDRLPPSRDLGESALGKKLGKGQSLGGGIGKGVGDGIGNGSGSQFFELATAGTKFVYVLDGSSSMTEPHSEARNRLERVKIELIRSIGGLPEQMEFFVIFFNRQSVPMPAEKLQLATPANKRKYLEWCVKVRGGGGTDPRAALKKALELKPDVIYLLTDGVFKAEAVDEVTKLNTRGVSIHTFCIGDAAGEAIVKAIASKNNGTYLYIP
jgi:hypothetical protein